jgi:hypothetical protein
VDRRHELENLRRSIVMLTPGVGALSREEALVLLEGLTSVRERLDKLQLGLRRLLDETEMS